MSKQIGTCRPMFWMTGLKRNRWERKCCVINVISAFSYRLQIISFLIELQQILIAQSACRLEYCDIDGSACIWNEDYPLKFQVLWKIKGNSSLGADFQQKMCKKLYLIIKWCVNFKVFSPLRQRVINLYDNS